MSHSKTKQTLKGHEGDIRILSRDTIVEGYQHHGSDTGSSEVQIALLTQDILNLDIHMKMNPKDFHSRRGLLRKVSLRRRLLKYLKGTQADRYQEVIRALGLRG